MTKILFKRGQAEANLPILDPGEPAITFESGGSFWIGTPSGNLEITGGGGGTPGGSDTQVQFNDSGIFGGDAGLTWDNSGKVLGVTNSSVLAAVPFLQLENTGGTNGAIYLSTTTQSATIGFASGSFNVLAPSSTWNATGSVMQFTASDSLSFYAFGVPGLTFNDAAGYEAVLNEGGLDFNFRIEGVTATSLFVTDAGLDAVQIGTTTAGDIADFRSSGIVFNESGDDRDFRIETSVSENTLFIDGGNGRMGIGTATPSFPIHSINDNGNNSAFETYSDTASVGAVQILRKGRGSFASPGTVQNGDTLGGFAFGGYQSGFHNPILITGIVTENWTGTAHGAKISFATTVNGSTARTEKMSLQNGLQIGSPTGGDPGSGWINVAGGIKLNNTSYTNPDYALHHYFHGNLGRFSDNPGADKYGGLLPLDDLRTYMRDHMHLPNRWDSQNIFEWVDMAQMWCEELAIYCTQLHSRVAALEGAQR